MIDFGKWAFANKKLVYFLLAVLLAGGALAAYDMPKLEDPEIKVKMAMVVATYPGASAHEVEMEVTDPLEKSIRAIGEVDNVSSWSYNDLALIEVELKSTVPDADVEQSWDMLRRKVGDTRTQLPQGASVQVQDDFGLVYGMLYALTGDGLTERRLSDYAELIRREIGECLREHPRLRGDLFLEHGAYRYRLAFDCEACEMSLVDPLEKREPEGV